MKGHGSRVHMLENSEELLTWMHQPEKLNRQKNEQRTRLHQPCIMRRLSLDSREIPARNDIKATPMARGVALGPRISKIRRMCDWGCSVAVDSFKGQNQDVFFPAFGIV